MPRRSRKTDITQLASAMRSAVDSELPEDEPNDVRQWVYETCARVALEWDFEVHYGA